MLARTSTMMLSRRLLLSSSSSSTAATVISSRSPAMAATLMRTYATAGSGSSSGSKGRKPAAVAPKPQRNTSSSIKAPADKSTATAAAAGGSTGAPSSSEKTPDNTLARDVDSSSTASPTSVPPTPSDSTESPIPSTTASPSSSTLTTDPAPASASATDANALSRQSSLAESFLDYTEVAANPQNTKGSTFPGEVTGARAKGSGTKSSIEQKRANLTKMLVGAGVVTVLYAGWTLGRPWEDDTEKMKLCGRSEDQDAIEDADEGGFKGWIARMRLRGADQLDYLNKPAWDPLLPPPLPEPHYRPYTLVIDLDDMLIHAVWDIEHGWRTAKRPGVDYFLAYLSQFYEIVLFTTQPAYTAAPIVERLDPYGAYIPWKLFRESTRYKNKTLIKDLSYLGRPLERTVILDVNPEHTQLQPDNAIHLAPWQGSKGDETAKELVSLIPFLEALAVRGVKDVRPIIKHYEGRHIPTAYAEVEAKTKRELVEKWEKEKEKASHGWGKWIREAVGGLTKNPRSDQPPETDIEKIRKNAQRLYLEEQKYWKDNEEAIKKQIEEDKERQLKEMKGSLLSFMGIAPPSGAPQQGAEQPK